MTARLPNCWSYKTSGQRAEGMIVGYLRLQSRRYLQHDPSGLYDQYFSARCIKRLIDLLMGVDNGFEVDLASIYLGFQYRSNSSY